MQKNIVLIVLSIVFFHASFAMEGQQEKKRPADSSLEAEEAASKKARYEEKSFSQEVIAEFLQAIKDENSEMVSRMLRHYGRDLLNIEHICASGMPLNALQASIVTGKYTVAKLLLEDFKADIRQPNSRGLEVIHLAAQCWSSLPIKFALDRGAPIDVSSQDDKKLTPFVIAARDGRELVVSFLLGRGAHIKAALSGLVTAIGCGRENVIRCILNLRPMLLQEEFRQEGIACQPLYLALTRKNLTMQLELIRRGAVKVNKLMAGAGPQQGNNFENFYRITFGNSVDAQARLHNALEKYSFAHPLHPAHVAAALSDKRVMLPILLDSAPDGQHGFTIESLYNIAAAWDNHECAALLKPAMELATKKALTTDDLRVLLDSDIDSDGNTQLHRATMAMRPCLVKTLLQNSQHNLEHRNKAGQTAAQKAIEHDQYGMAFLIREFIMERAVASQAPQQDVARQLQESGFDTETNKKLQEAGFIQ